MLYYVMGMGGGGPDLIDGWPFLSGEPPGKTTAFKTRSTINFLLVCFIEIIKSGVTNFKF